MGTSQSSNGPPSRVPMVPPWVPDPPVPEPPPEDGRDGDTSDDGREPNTPHNPEPQQPVPIAPAGRFGSTRRSLGDYARSGDYGSMRRGVGHYVRGGYGGTQTATRRFAGTAQAANTLYAALSGGAASPYAVPGGQLDPVLMAGRSADAIMDAVVEAVRPVDGTQDAESGRAAIRDALSDVLTRFPDADLLNLDQEQREFAIERYMAWDVFRRFDLDVGRTIRQKAPDAATGLARLKEAREYIRETVAASFRRLRGSMRQMVAGRVAQVVRDALADAFRVFEEYAL